MSNPASPPESEKKPPLLAPPSRPPPPVHKGLRRLRKKIDRAAVWALTREPAIRLRDGVANARWTRNGGGEVFLVRHPILMPFFYHGFLHWLERNFPGSRGHFRLALLPCDLPASPTPRLLAPWLQDPIDAWSPEVHAWTVALADSADARGVGVINRPEHLSNIRKSRTARLLAPLGIRTPRTALLSDGESLARVMDTFPRPFFIRDDDTHTGRMILIDARQTFQSRDLKEFGSPVAIEFIDTRGPDGLFRKYRYQAAGNIGVSVHQVTSRYWEVRDRSKLRTDDVYREEAVYVSAPDPNHETLQRARSAMKLEFVAFDYAYDQYGQLTVWEANGYPSLFFTPGPPSLRWRDAPMHRIFAAMLGLYLDHIGAPIPWAVDDLRRYAKGSERIIDRLDASRGWLQRLLPAYTMAR